MRHDDAGVVEATLPAGAGTAGSRSRVPEARIDCPPRPGGLSLLRLTDTDTLMRKAVQPSVLVGPILLLGLGTGCTPTVKVATDEPITINLNVNIRHEILVKVDRELDDLFSDDSELF